MHSGGHEGGYHDNGYYPPTAHDVPIAMAMAMLGEGEGVSEGARPCLTRMSSSTSNEEDTTEGRTLSGGRSTPARSTKGASKHRRDLINGEISTLRDLLPLPESARQRLSQLQIMSLGCVYIRKCNYFARLFGQTSFTQGPLFEFSQSMTGFLLISTREGKLLYISENVTEFLGHSMVDMMTQGDSLYDIIDKRDHAGVQTQLLQQPSYSSGGQSGSEQQEERTFFCRMNVARSFRRQAGFGDHKVMHVRGHFMQPLIRDQYGSQQVFMAFCTPLITPDVKETVVQNNTMMYQSVHGLDMAYTELGPNGEFHLGYSEEELQGRSWYGLIHPEDIHEAKEKHTQLIKSSHEMGCMLTIRLQTKCGEWVWVNMVMHIRQPFVCDNGDPTIVCINHVIREVEAQHFKVQSQLYSSHIARSPEFLPSPQRVNPPHTITQVPVEQEQYPLQGYPIQQSQGDASSIGFYHAQFGVAVTPATEGGEPVQQPLQSDIAPFPNGSSQYTGSIQFKEMDRKERVRVGILNRLKRRKIQEEVEQEECMPPVKLEKCTTDCSSPDGSPAGISLTLTSSFLAGPGFDLPRGFAASGVGGPQVLIQSADGPLYEQLMLRKPVEVLEQVAHVLPNVPEMSPPTPLTPDSLPDALVSSNSIGGHTTNTAGQTWLTVETNDSAMVPSFMLTPDSSPAASPIDTLNTSHEQCVPSLFPDLADIQALTEADMETDSMLSQVKALKAKEVRPATKLPELDLHTLEDYLTGLTGGVQQAMTSADVQPPMQPKVAAAPATAIPQMVVEMSEAYSPATSTSSMEEETSSQDLMKVDSCNLDEAQLDNLVASVTDVILSLAQANQQQTNHVDISGGFVVVPGHEAVAQRACSPEQTCPEMTSSPASCQDDSDDTCQILSPEVTGELMDELHQLNELAGSTPSYGDEDLTSSLFDQTL